MKYACMSCDTRYDIPDDKIAAKEPAGLRIRCRTCRAIMVVSLARRLDDDDGAEDVTAPALVRRRRRRPPAAVAAGGLAATAPSVDDMPELTGMHASPNLGESFELPATTNDAGDVVPKSGVFRSLTGVHMSPAAKSKSRRERPSWFAALGGKPRGPYTAAEMERLAQQGRVRGSTLVWGPGLAEWSQIRSRTNEKTELQWLRSVVVARKKSESLAQDKAQRVHGITRLQLDEQHLERSPPPPPLPLDDESTDSEFAADSIFGPTHLGPLVTTAGEADQLARQSSGDDGTKPSGEFPMGWLIVVGLVTGAMAAAGVFYALSTFGLYALPAISS